MTSRSRVEMEEATVDRLLTMEEAGRQLAVSRWTVFRLAKQRHIVSVVVGSRCRRVTASSVDAYIRSRIEEQA